MTPERDPDAGPPESDSDAGPTEPDPDARPIEPNSDATSPDPDPETESPAQDPTAESPAQDLDTAPTVRATYDRIAEHFAKTRANPWPEVESFLSTVACGAVGLDVGCGNGRHVRPLADRADRVVGLDVSRALLEVAADEVLAVATDDGPQVDDADGDRDEGRLDVDLVQADAVALPLSDGVVDVGVYVATVHHLRSRAARIRSLDELARVMASGGRALVSAWSTEHDRFDATAGFDTTVDWTLPGGETVPRFYHIYDPGEFRTDLDRSDLQVVEAFVSSGNCYAEVKG